jgi:hypothetical protein
MGRHVRSRDHGGQSSGRLSGRTDSKGICKDKASSVSDRSPKGRRPGDCLCLGDVVSLQPRLRLIDHSVEARRELGDGTGGLGATYVEAEPVGVIAIRASSTLRSKRPNRDDPAGF